MARTTKSSRALLQAVVLFPAMIFLWVLCTGSWNRDEDILGVTAAILSTIFTIAVFRQYECPMSFRLADLVQVWRVPISIVSKVISITGLLARDLAGSRLPSLYRICRFEVPQDDALANARRVLATAYTTAAPNFIILGVDARHREMMFHQIQRTQIPAETRKLGARPWLG